MKIKHLKSISFLWVGTLIGSGSSFIIFTILGKNYGPLEFGEFTSSLSIISLFVLISGFGISKLWLKLFGEAGWQSLSWIKPSLKLISLTTILAISGVLFLAFFANHSNNTKYILIVLTFFLTSQILFELVSSKYQLEEKFELLAVWQFSPNLTRLFLIALLLYVVKPLPSIILIASIFSFVAIIIIIISIRELFKLDFNRFELKGHIKNPPNFKEKYSIKEVFIQAMPFGLGAVFAFIYVQVDVIMLKYMYSSTESGYYYAAYTILAAIYTIPNVLFNKFLLPKIHRWSVHDKKKFKEAYSKGNFLMLLMGLVSFIALYVFSNYIITFLFGNEFEKSIELLKILSFTLPFFLMAYSTSATLVTQNHMIKKAFFMFVTALFNVVLNFILIPKYGAAGASYATITSNALLLCLYFYANHKYVFKANYS